MIHPTIFRENKCALVIKGDALNRLIDYPKQILWIRFAIDPDLGGNAKKLFAIVPIETIKRRAAFVRTYCVKTRCLVFVWDENDVAEIPEQVGQELEHCNGNRR